MNNAIVCTHVCLIDSQVTARHMTWIVDTWHPRDTSALRVEQELLFCEGKQ